MRRNAVQIKAEILDFCKSNTAEYKVQHQRVLGETDFFFSTTKLFYIFFPFCQEESCSAF